MSKKKPKEKRTKYGSELGKAFGEMSEKKKKTLRKLIKPIT